MSYSLTQAKVHYFTKGYQNGDAWNHQLSDKVENKGVICIVYLLCPRRHSLLIKCVLGPAWTERTSPPCSFLKTTGADPQIHRTSQWTGNTALQRFRRVARQLQKKKKEGKIFERMCVHVDTFLKAFDMPSRKIDVAICQLPHLNDHICDSSPAKIKAQQNKLNTSILSCTSPHIHTILYIQLN